jgi:hypothetical protein
MGAPHRRRPRAGSIGSPHRDPGSFSNRAVDRELSCVQVDDRSGQRHPEAGALRFGGEEQVEHP